MRITPLVNRSVIANHEITQISVCYMYHKRGVSNIEPPMNTTNVTRMSLSDLSRDVTRMSRESHTNLARMSHKCGFPCRHRRFASQPRKSRKIIHERNALVAVSMVMRQNLT